MANIQCKNCGGSVELPTGRQSTTCPYCGGLVERTGSGHTGTGHYMLAKTAFESGNYEDAERFCNMHLAYAPDDVDALLLKAQAIGWQKGMRKNRLCEVATNFLQAIKRIEDPQAREELGSTIKREFLSIASRKISAAVGNFKLNSEDYDKTDALDNLLRDCDYAIRDLENETSWTIDHEVDKYEYAEPIIRVADKEVRAIWEGILEQIDCFYVQHLVRLFQMAPSRDAFFKLKVQFDNCETILMTVANNRVEDMGIVEKAHSTLSYFAKALDDNVGMDYERDEWGAYHQVQWKETDNEEICEMLWDSFYRMWDGIEWVKKRMEEK